MTNLSFKVPYRVVGVSLEPIPHRKRRSEPELEPEVETVEAEAIEAAPAVPDEAEIQARIAEEAAVLAETLAQEKVEPVRHMVEQALEKLTAEQEAFLEDVEQAAIRLAHAVARAVIRRELTVAPEAVKEVVREAVQKLPSARRLTIRCHPEDWELLHEDESLQKWREIHGAELEFRPDEDIERGGCVVESDNGMVDAQLKTRLRAVETELFAGEES